MTVVVAAAIVRDGVVLAAHRRSPVGWEFPGGKVEAGETEPDALIRECHEELGVEVRVGAWLGTSSIAPGVDLQLYAASLVSVNQPPVERGTPPMRGEPAPLVDHDELRWVDGSNLDALDWLPADRPLLDAVRAHLTR